MAGKSSKRPAGPEINYDKQVSTAQGAMQAQDLPHYLFALASEVAKRWLKESRKIGVLLVIGDFCNGKRCRAAGMRQLGGSNPLNGRFIAADSPEFAELLHHDDVLTGDGAIVINSTGQVLGASAYVVVDYPKAVIPEEGGSRHLAAASASIRPDVMATVTISEETRRVRLFLRGRVAAMFDPEKDE
jgi:DNA integrity scanning protein DisA with diadenylate cyclase activity